MADTLVTVDLRDQLDDLRKVIDLTIAGLRYASTDVAMAYAELHAERGNVRPLAELTERRRLRPLAETELVPVRRGNQVAAHPLTDYEPKPWTAEQLDRGRWRDSAANTRWFTRGGELT